MPVSSHALSPQRHLLPAATWPIAPMASGSAVAADPGAKRAPNTLPSVERASTARLSLLAPTRRLPSPLPASPDERVTGALVREANQGAEWAKVALWPNARAIRLDAGHLQLVAGHGQGRWSLSVAPPFAWGSFSEIAEAHSASGPVHWPFVVRTVYFFESGRSRSGKVYTSGVTSFAREMKALAASQSALLPQFFCSSGDGELHAIIPRYAFDALRFGRALLVRSISPRLDIVLFKVAADLFHRLDLLHRAGWLHLDICPRNLLIGTSTAELADFGFARRNKDRLSKHYVGGVYFYQPPEMLACLAFRTATAPTPAVDMFAAGLTLLDIALGDGRRTAHHLKKFPRGLSGERTDAGEFIYMFERLVANLHGYQSWCQAGEPAVEVGVELSWPSLAQAVDHRFGNEARQFIFSHLLREPSSRPAAAQSAAWAKDYLERAFYPPRPQMKPPLHTEQRHAFNQLAGMVLQVAVQAVTQD